MATAFPAGFSWGAATSAYQIEGAATADGRGESIWDRFCRTPGKVFNGDTGDVAADHYHRWPEDIEIMKSLGLKAYRFSIAWPRILPQGTGAVNEAGLDFYDRLVDGLLAAGIEPFATLYHWDLPQALQDRGGWPNRDVAGWFADYAAAVSSRLGDRVHQWITHNEPFVTAFLGHATGEHAPGIQDHLASIQVAHNLLLSHGRAVRALRRNGDARTRVGITLNFTWTEAASQSQEDLEMVKVQDAAGYHLFVDPLFKGSYPAEIAGYFGGTIPGAQPEDMAEIAAPIDLLGVNYYTRAVVGADLEGGQPGGREIRVPGSEYTEMGWEVYPEGLYKLLRRLHEDCGPCPLYITENGCAFADSVEGGQVHDARRLAYLQAHFAQARRAMEDGVPLRGYFVWSLLDNFEWAFGYSRRFGIVYVDYATQARIPKDSALWYKRVIAANAIPD